MTGIEARADLGAVAIVEIHQLYGRQSHLIDEGHASEWAATFTADGEFHSPSYPAPVVGVEALTQFATRSSRTRPGGGGASARAQQHRRRSCR